MSGSGNVKSFVGQSKAYNAVSRLFSKKKMNVYSGRGEEFSYWKRYLIREKAKVRGPEIWRPLVGYKKPYTHEWYYDEMYPQTFGSAYRQAVGKMPLVKPIKEWSIFLGDKVEVLVGKDKGKIGEVVEIFKERNWCFVEGLHTYYMDASVKKVKPYLRGTKAFIAVEKPLLVTHEVKLIDPADQCATEFEWRYSEDGERVRVSVRTGRVIPIPHCHKNTWDDHTKAWEVKPSKKDTTATNLQQVTYEPKLCRFEEDIAESMGLTVEAIEKRSYWY